MAGKITISSVAKAANVSVATISRVLNDNPRVKEETKKHVKKIMEEMRYTPNLLGRNLRKESSNILYVVLPSIENPFYSKIVHQIEIEARSSDYEIMLCETYNEEARYLKFAEAAGNRLADGIILLSPVFSEHIPHLGEIPVVICGESSDRHKCCQVDIDNVRAAEDAAEHLIKSGCVNIGLITGDFNSGRLREEGYKKALKNAGMAIDENLIIRHSYSYEDGCRAAKEFAANYPRADAVFAVSDILAIGAVNGFTEKGLSVPGDVSVMGFDDISYAAFHKPSISTIMQPREEMGKQAFEKMLRLLSGGDLSICEKTILPHRLIKRESTK